MAPDLRSLPTIGGRGLRRLVDSIRGRRAPTAESIAPPAGPPSFSSFIQHRHAEWWSGRRKGVHSAKTCQDVLLHHDDDEQLWHCCRLWQRKLSNKLNAKEFSIRCGVPTAKVYWSGKDARKIPFDKLPRECVIKTSIGWSSRQVLPLIDGVSVFDGELYEPRRVIDKYRMIMSKKPVSRGQVFVEEFLQPEDEHGVPSDYKCYVFDGKVAYVAVIDRNEKSQR